MHANMHECTFYCVCDTHSYCACVRTLIYTNTYFHCACDTHSYCACVRTLICMNTHRYCAYDTHSYCACVRTLIGTKGWRRPLICLNLQVIFHKRATNYRALSTGTNVYSCVDTRSSAFGECVLVLMCISAY